MLFTDIIRKKRDGAELTDSEIQFFVDGLALGRNTAMVGQNSLFHSH